MTSLLKPVFGIRTALLAIAFAAQLAGCVGPTLREDIEPVAPSYARTPAETGILSEMAQAVQAEHGDEFSGFRLLDGSKDGLMWRLAIMDSAVDSIDIQTYLWYPDNSGTLVLDRALRAADRGVKVRLIVDDLLTVGLDQAMYELQRHPNIQLRLFNPWKKRGLFSRAGEMIVKLERLNTRMHDKLVIADGRAAIVGGRNLGDHYFGLSKDYNFHDLDLLGFGAIAEQTRHMFDHFWNSEWVTGAENIDLVADAEYAAEQLAAIRGRIASAPELESFPRVPKDWSEELSAVQREWHPGISRLVYDEAQENTITQNVAKRMFSFMDLAREELLVTNAYIIPGEPAIDFVRQLTDRGVKVRILTNSLESHDVPAVNSHYKGWRDDFIQAGAELFELRADAEIQSLVNVPPVQGEFVGLHTKSVVVDRKYVFIGSMNFDPRSFDINTEAGAFVHSEGLANELALVMNRDMQPENAWQVNLDEDGDTYWVNSDMRVDRQPARNGMQRVMDMLFRMFPSEQY